MPPKQTKKPNQTKKEQPNLYRQARNDMTSILKEKYAEMMNVVTEAANKVAAEIGFDAAQRIKTIGETWILNDWSVIPPFATSMLFDAYIKRQRQTLESQASDKVKAAVLDDLRKTIVKMKQLEELIL